MSSVNGGNGTCVGNASDITIGDFFRMVNLGVASGSNYLSILGKNGGVMNTFSRQGEDNVDDHDNENENYEENVFSEGPFESSISIIKREIFTNKNEIQNARIEIQESRIESQQTRLDLQTLKVNSRQSFNEINKKIDKLMESNKIKTTQLVKIIINNFGDRLIHNYHNSTSGSSHNNHHSHQHHNQYNSSSKRRRLGGTSTGSVGGGGNGYGGSYNNDGLADTPLTPTEEELLNLTEPNLQPQSHHIEFDSPEQTKRNGHFLDFEDDEQEEQEIEDADDGDVNNGALNIDPDHKDNEIGGDDNDHTVTVTTTADGTAIGGKHKGNDGKADEPVAFDELEHQDGTTDIGEFHQKLTQHQQKKLPLYKMIRGTDSIKVIWEEYTRGINGNPSVKSLEEKYHNKWKDDTERKYFGYRKKLYTIIENIMRIHKVSEDEAVDWVEKFITDNLGNKRSMTWLYENIQSEYR